MSILPAIAGALEGRAAAYKERTSPTPPLSCPSFLSIFEAEVSYVAHALQRLGVPDGDVDDVAHEVFMTVHRRLASYDPARPLRPWLFGIALKHASDFRKRAHRRHEIVMEVSECLPDASPGPESEASRRQLQALVLRALDGIELGKRAVLILHDIDGRSASEIADALEIPLNTVYSRLRVAREKFRELVRLEGGIP